MLLLFIFFVIFKNWLQIWPNGSPSTQISLHPIMSPGIQPPLLGWHGGNNCLSCTLSEGFKTWGRRGQDYTVFCHFPYEDKAKLCGSWCPAQSRISGQTEVDTGCLAPALEVPPCPKQYHWHGVGALLTYKLYVKTIMYKRPRGA